MFEKFVEENITRDITNFEITDDLYKRYLLFCRFYKIESITRSSFAHLIRKFGVGIHDNRKRKGRDGKVGRWGVKLLPCKY